MQLQPNACLIVAYRTSEMVGNLDVDEGARSWPVAVSSLDGFIQMSDGNGPVGEDSEADGALIADDDEVSKTAKAMMKFDMIE